MPQGAKFCQVCGTSMMAAGSTGAAPSAAEKSVTPKLTVPSPTPEKPAAPKLTVPSPAPAASPIPVSRNPVPPAGANTAAAVQNVIEWIDTTVKASDTPGEFVAAGWSEGRAIDPRTILNAAAKVVTAAVQQTAPTRTASANPQTAGKKPQMPGPETSRLRPTAPAKTPRITPNTSIPPGAGAQPGNAAQGLFCRYCGKPLTQGTKFCGYCGKQIG